MTVLVVEKPIAPSVDAASFKLAMRNTAASVNVITCGSDEGDFGLTATAFSSVTADPPTVLIAVNSGASIYPHLLKQRRFAVNVLSADALQVSNDFAGGLPPEERFARHAWTRLSSGNPALAASSAGFDCVVTELSQVGSHLVVLGRVEHCWYSDQQPLLYSNGRYGRFV
ncbi:flavin reductase family protein [Pseudomonas sp. 21LCFQ02]|nr:MULTISPECIES: flavin reductase family protein [unclassified Pseudomonas]MCO8163787.1 flavin reductase family protein [Pseudomonas sp. 21LCFQ010]MCO8170743.1 flavin reductase family protein [Pseudomonas sp. 21LCFQ02]BAP45720.1 flavin reductase-like protein [Pseudomonas sp. StFLB209]